MWETMHGAQLPGVAINTPTSEESISGRRDSLRCELLQVAATNGDEKRGAKRQRIDSADRTEPQRNTFNAEDIIKLDLMAQLVDFYFDNFHHWIPILHARCFQQQIRSADGRKQVVYILYAMVAACFRFIDSPGIEDEKKIQVAEECRQKVVLCSMETFSVENLQALVIVAFDTIARGRGPSSWSIVGSMARTVEQLGLSIEEETLNQVRPGEALIQRMAFLKSSTCWREAEERRRVFWTVFLMDRFCSVSTGWNFSLTTADVKRRLPCEGILWYREQEVRAPYFGISDSKGVQNQSLLDRRLDADPEEDSIGGLAYCVEATESLALVSNFFVQQPLNVRNAEETQMWLMRFKELDLRLVQWKLFLPPKWREASTLNADGIMDSNLTLAHITHITVVILLHQAIAYPPQHWRSSSVKLPSSSSAETCIEAASEISALGQQFLRTSSMLTNPQFSFCLFVAGRMLLTHARYNATPVPAALDTLISSLFEISGRWAGPRDINGPEKGNLATVFAKRLVQARDSVSHGAKCLDIRQPVYSEATEDGMPSRDRLTGSPRADPSSYPSPNPMDMSMNIRTNPFQETSFHGEGHFADFYETSSDSSLTLAFPPLPLSFQQSFMPFADPAQNSSLEADAFNFQLDLSTANGGQSQHADPRWNGL